MDANWRGVVLLGLGITLALRGMARESLRAEQLRIAARAVFVYVVMHPKGKAAHDQSWNSDRRLTTNDWIGVIDG